MLGGHTRYYSGKTHRQLMLYNLYQSTKQKKKKNGGVHRGRHCGRWLYRSYPTTVVVVTHCRRPRSVPGTFTFIFFFFTCYLFFVLYLYTQIT